MKIDYNGKFFFTVDANSKYRSPLIAAGFTPATSGDWNFVCKDPKVAYKFFNIATGRAREEILNKLNLWPIPFDPHTITWPEGLEPLDRQIEGAKWILSRRSSYIAYDPGLGKTATFILARNAEPGPTIIFCPSFLAFNWKHELETWSVRPLNIKIYSGMNDKFEKGYDVHIVPFSIMISEKLRESFMDQKFDWLCIDEAHGFKNIKAKRSQSLFGGEVWDGHTSEKKVWKGFKEICNRLVHLSGSPMPNGRPIELFPLLYHHAPHVIQYMDEHFYGCAYCDGKKTEFGWNYQGASNVSKLDERLKNDFMIVKTVDDCLDLTVDERPKFIYVEDDRKKETRTSEEAILKKISLPEILELERKHNAKLSKLLNRHTEIPEGSANDVFGMLSRIRKATGLRKIYAAADAVREIIKEGESVVVFAYHTEVIRKLKVELEKFNPLVITGATLKEDRHEIVQEFQNSKDPIPLIANINAAGVGITLTRASKVLIVEPSWVPEENRQAIKRLSRTGQTKRVQAYYLVYPNSIDHLVLNSNVRKNKVIKEVMS